MNLSIKKLKQAIKKWKARRTPITIEFPAFLLTKIRETGSFVNITERTSAPGVIFSEEPRAISTIWVGQDGILADCVEKYNVTVIDLLRDDFLDKIDGEDMIKMYKKMEKLDVEKINEISHWAKQDLKLKMKEEIPKSKYYKLL